MRQILPERPHVIGLTATELIKRFPDLNEAYSLQEPNRERFGKLWTNLRRRRLAKLKNDVNG